MVKSNKIKLVFVAATIVVGFHSGGIGTAVYYGIGGIIGCAINDFIDQMKAVAKTMEDNNTRLSEIERGQNRERMLNREGKGRELGSLKELDEYLKLLQENRKLRSENECLNNQLQRQKGSQQPEIETDKKTGEKTVRAQDYNYKGL
jgi:hypothetical protein